MCGKSSDSAFEIIKDRLQQASSILGITHARPDGDGLGSMIALTLAARAVGKKAQMLLHDESPVRYSFLLENVQPSVGAENFTKLAQDADVIVVFDTSAAGQLDEFSEPLSKYREKVIVIDHHVTSDGLCDVQLVDSSAAATGVLIYELLEALDWPIDFDAANALATAITTDTGWLRFSNTDSRALGVMGKLFDAGVEPDVLYKKIYQSDRPQRMNLLIKTLESLELHCNDRLAVMTISKADFDATGAKPDETENFINEALRLESVEAAVLLVENHSAIRVSLRSRGAVDVAMLAQGFGGGGHSRAAGLRADQDMDSLKDELIKEFSKALG